MNALRNRNADIARHGLNYVMEFDHVIQVHADGSVTDTGVYAPEMTGDSATGTASLDSDDWTIMSDGYTSQQGGGNVMHNCESIGAGLERDILATPGFYVAVYCTWDDGTPCIHCGVDVAMDEYGSWVDSTEGDGCDNATNVHHGDTDTDTVIEGWCVAYRETLTDSA